MTGGNPMENLRIAIIAPPWYPVPPTGYGGIEVVVYLLAHELARHGHEVTVIGRQGGRNDFELLALSPESWTASLGSRDHQAREATYVRRAYQVIRQRAFDIVHDNTGYLGLVVASLLQLQSAPVSTLHGDLTEADGHFLTAIDVDVALVAISRAQQATVAGVRWAGVVPNAVDERELDFGPKPGDYLVQLARICPEKGQHVAIEVARRADKRLVLAGKVGEGADGYFKEQIEPHLHDGVEWVENVSGRDKSRLLAGAAAMIFPIQWEEPFGIAMVEAMASGAPVVATPRGAASEIVEEGVTGLFGADVDQLVEAVGRVNEIDRRRCSEYARDRFSAGRMAEGYLGVYRNAIARKRDAL
jgi:glycosyltransferase involved in cell wall biosynthesis